MVEHRQQRMRFLKEDPGAAGILFMGQDKVANRRQQQLNSIEKWKVCQKT